MYHPVNDNSSPMDTPVPSRFKFNFKYFVIFLCILFMACGAYVTVGNQRLDTVRGHISNLYETHVKPIQNKLSSTYLKTLVQDENGDELNENEEDEESNNETSDLDLNELEDLISSYNSAADKSKGVLERYSGPRSAVEYAKWALDRLLNSNNSSFSDEASNEDSEFEKKVASSKITAKDSLEKKVVTKQPSLITESSEKTDRANSSILGGTRVPNPEVEKRLVLFSTWIDQPDKRLAMENVLRTWRLWEPLILPLVFTNDLYIQQEAKKHGWAVLPEPKTKCQKKIPILREMFRSAMANFKSALYGYVNGDLLLGNGLLSTVEALVNNKAMMSKPMMAAMRRVNVNFVDRSPLTHVNDLSAIADEGKIMSDGSSDGFITNKLFPWDHMPDVVPGYPGVAMFVVSYAREMGVQVVDISETVKVVHQTVTKAGNREGWTKKDKFCNHNEVGRLNAKPQSWYCGFIFCAQFRTYKVKIAGQTEILIEDKSRKNSKRCGECHMYLSKLKNTKF